MNLVMPTINNITLEGYQVCTHYTVLKFGKTRANEDMAESEKSAALSLYYGVAIRESFPLSRTLKNENKSITEQTKVIVDEYKEFFKGAADKVIDKWEVDLQGMKSRYKEAT